MWCSKDKGWPCLKKCQRSTLYWTLTRPLPDVAMVMKFLSPPGRGPPGQQDLSQIRKGICPAPLPPYRRKVYVPQPISKRNFYLGPFLCFLAIKTDQQHMFGLYSPGLLGIRPAVLAVTLPSNKSCLLYILPCVWKFFSNPRSDHDRIFMTRGFRSIYF